MDAEQDRLKQHKNLQKIAEQLLEAVPRLMRLISAEAQASDTEGALTMTQLRVLGQLTRGQRLPSELARELRITPATASEVIDLLVRRGLVERGDQPLDRRLSPLRITPDGSNRLNAARQRALATLARLLDRLESRDRSTVERGTRLLLEALRESERIADGSDRTG